MDDMLVLHGFTSDGAFVIRTEEKNITSFPRYEVVEICVEGTAVFHRTVPLYVEAGAPIGGPIGPFAVGRIKFSRSYIMSLLKGRTTDLSILLLEVDGKPRHDPIPFVVPPNLPTN